MKKKTLLTIILLSFPIFVLSQTLNIHKNDGSVHNFDMSAIDSITFTESSIASNVCPGIPTVTYEGKTYNTVQIGDHCWLKENLDLGTMITSNSDSDNQTDNGIVEKYCYGNSEANCGKYGGLYQWNEAMQYTTSEGAQGICPPGWHIPTYSDFQTLIDAVNGSSNALKAIGQGEGAGAGTNTSGFSALLAGNRSVAGGDFYELGGNADLWSSAEAINDGMSEELSLYSLNDSAYFGRSAYHFYWGNGLSVRCLRD